MPRTGFIWKYRTKNTQRETNLRPLVIVTFSSGVMPITHLDETGLDCNGYIYIYTYRVSQEERTKLRERVPYVKLYRYNPKHLCPKLNGFRDNGK